MLALAGVTVMVFRVALLTVRVVDPETPPNVAERVVAPGKTPVARPLLPAVSPMVAIAGADEVHVTESVKFCVPPSAKDAIAVYCSSTWTGTLAAVGVTAIDCSADDSTTILAVFDIVPSCALMTAAPAD
jgi:hypothetical protein